LAASYSIQSLSSLSDSENIIFAVTPLARVFFRRPISRRQQQKKKKLQMFTIHLR
jgi:hypothetical protein